MTKPDADFAVVREAIYLPDVGADGTLYVPERVPLALARLEARLEAAEGALRKLAGWNNWNPQDVQDIALAYFASTEGEGQEQFIDVVVPGSGYFGGPVTKRVPVRRTEGEGA